MGTGRAEPSVPRYGKTLLCSECGLPGLPAPLASAVGPKLEGTSKHGKGCAPVAASAQAGLRPEGRSDSF